MTQPTFEELRTVLETSHDRLAGLLAPLSAEQAEQQSYDDEWSIGQVASHLGSGAEIFGMIVDAGLLQTAPPGPDQFQPVWARWNAKSAGEQAQDVIATDRSFLDRLAGLAPDEVDRWRLEFFGASRDLPQLLQMRLGEHAVHTWDIAVALDPSATVADDAVEVLIDTMSPLVGRAGKPSDSPVQVSVVTTEPGREFVLDLNKDGVGLSSGSGGDEELRLPAEAFIRLLYGRLDAGHTPESVESSVDLDVLRAAFPGF